MPFVALVVFAFVLGLAFDRRASRGTWIVLALGAAAATVWYMR